MTSGGASIPYIGSKISLVTCSDLRYDGTLVNINTAQSTVTLRNVRIGGSADSKAPGSIPPSSEVYDYIVFSGKDIKDLTVSDPAPSPSVRNDPAIVAVNCYDPTGSPFGHMGSGHMPMGMGGPMGGPMPGMMGGPMPGLMGGPMPPMAGAMGGNVNHHMPPHMDGHMGSHMAMMGGYRGHRDGAFYGRNGYGSPGRYNRGNARHRGGVVGELSAQPSVALKQQVASAFDFEQARAEFAKRAPEEAEGAGGNKNQDGEGAAAPVVTSAYNKENSFFDTVSCEYGRGRKGGVTKQERERLRDRDAETFGQASTRPTKRPFNPRRSPRQHLRYDFFLPLQA